MAARDLLPAQQRDMTDPDLWVRSRWRSRARRDAAATRSEMPKPSPRGLSLAALLAVAGGPAVGVASGLMGSTATAVAKPAVASRGGGVTALQRAVGVGADGVFGPQTAKAVKAYQRSHGLAVDGIAGPQTRSRLGMGAGPVFKRKSAGASSGGDGGGGDSSVVQRVIAAGNRIATAPYLYGGGHGSFRSPAGYDCSGSVSYALHGGGLLGAPMPSGGFTSYGAPGPGKHITIYANGGHMYMTVDGRRFDTSSRKQSGSRWTSEQRSSAGYTVRHPPGL
ncbi:MAG: peptidoglycan-binding domain-containing protein [Thermoleophilaceae bacterium]